MLSRADDSTSLRAAGRAESDSENQHMKFPQEIRLCPRNLTPCALSCYGRVGCADRFASSSFSFSRSSPSPRSSTNSVIRLRSKDFVGALLGNAWRHANLYLLLVGRRGHLHRVPYPRLSLATNVSLSRSEQDRKSLPGDVDGLRLPVPARSRGRADPSAAHRAQRKFAGLRNVRRVSSRARSRSGSHRDICRPRALRNLARRRRCGHWNSI